MYRSKRHNVTPPSSRQNGYPAYPYSLCRDLTGTFTHITTPMGKFQDLAIELISEIFSYLDCIDLSELCLVSRLFNLIAECLLYKSVRLYKPKRRQSRITPFLRTILNRPTLARHVQLLHLGWWWSLNFVPGAYSNPQTGQDNTWSLPGYHT